MQYAVKSVEGFRHHAVIGNLIKMLGRENDGFVFPATVKWSF